MQTQENGDPLNSNNDSYITKYLISVSFYFIFILHSLVQSGDTCLQYLILVLLYIVSFWNTHPVVNMFNDRAEKVHLKLNTQGLI